MSEELFRGGDSLSERALAYHEHPRPGKTGIALSKPADTAADLTLAYSPGVASPCLEVEKDAAAAYRYTNNPTALPEVVASGNPKTLP